MVKHVAIFPASHYIVPKEKIKDAILDIETEMEEQVKQFTEQGKLIEAQRIAQRTMYDMEMLQEVGICKGIENYSRVLSRRAAGSVPCTLLITSRRFFVVLWMRAMSCCRNCTRCTRRPCPQAKPCEFWLSVAVGL